MNCVIVTVACHSKYEAALFFGEPSGKSISGPAALGKEITQTCNRIVNWQMCIKTVLMSIQEMWTRG
jgi:hypothetical protein